MYNTKPINNWVIRLSTFLQLFVSLYGKTIFFFSEIKRFILFLNEINPFIIVLDYESESEKEDILKQEEPIQETALQKPEIIYENKYVEAFKKFPNEFQFTDEELEQEQSEFVRIKTEAHHKIEQNRNEILKRISVIDKLLHKNSDQEQNNNKVEETKILQYFQLEEDYEEYPDSIDFAILYLEVMEEKTKYEEELKQLEETASSLLDDEEIKKTAHQYIINLKLDKLMNSYILEYTPLGNIFMRYSNDKKSFEYFSNSTIPYRYLEPVGQKYVMTYWCKPIFIDIEEELKKAELKYEEDKKKGEQKVPETKALPKDIMAKMKSYNKDLNMPSKNRNQTYALPPQIQAQLPNIKTNSEKQLLKENANRYTWEGRMANFSLLKKIDKKIVNKTLEMSFADFKRMQNGK
jgi:hypothetical protein